MEHSLDTFYTKKHRRISAIATTASVFAWLVLLFSILVTMSQFVTFFRYQSYPSLQSLYQSSPETVINAFLEMAYALLQGFAFFLGLRGIYLGLNMIIETELNYRERTGGDNHD